jgi:hypothetical protein
MSFVSSFLRGEVTLWRSFWFGAFVASAELWGTMFGHFILPMPTYRYSDVEAIVRLSLLITYIAFHLPFFYGTWKAANNYEGKVIWKVSTKFVCGLFIFILALGLFVEGMDLFFTIKYSA